MHTNFQTQVVCTTRAASQLPRIIEAIWFLGLILFLALLQNPGPAFAAGPPSASVNLKWDLSSSLEVTGYRIYYGATPGNYTNSMAGGNATSNTVSGLIKGGTYYFAVKAYNSIGLESIFSNEIVYVVPGGPGTLQIRVATNRQAILTLTGQVGHTYEIQATPDLKVWSVINTMTLGASATGNYTNTSAPNYPKRFYRTRDITP